jgi:hypothetical protein
MLGSDFTLSRTSDEATADNPSPDRPPRALLLHAAGLSRGLRRGRRSVTERSGSRDMRPAGTGGHRLGGVPCELRRPRRPTKRMRPG